MKLVWYNPYPDLTSTSTVEQIAELQLDTTVLQCRVKSNEMMQPRLGWEVRVVSDDPFVWATLDEGIAPTMDDGKTACLNALKKLAAIFLELEAS